MQLISKQQCYHCHSPLLPNSTVYLIVAGKKQPVCCYGCQAVASALLALNQPNTDQPTECKPLVKPQ